MVTPHMQLPKMFNLVVIFINLLLTACPSKQTLHVHEYKKGHVPGKHLQLHAKALPGTEVDLDDAWLTQASPFVLGAKGIDVPEVHYPYNPSLVRLDDNGYLLAYRYDENPQEILGRLAYIGVVELDHDFKVKGTPQTLALGAHAQDPRLLWSAGRLYVFYNNPPIAVWNNREVGTHRAMHRAELVKQSGQWVVKNIEIYLTRERQTQKNWVPFHWQTANQMPLTLMAYSLSPHLMMVPDEEEEGNVAPFSYCSTSSVWPKQYGTIRGGTPAILVDGQYIGIFHSSFVHPVSQLHMYVMGAYVFDARPPFCITRMSSKPIVFDGMYDDRVQGSGKPNARVVFPAGLVETQYQGQEAFAVSYGKNDSACQVVFLDKKGLLASLK